MHNSLGVLGQETNSVKCTASTHLIQTDNRLTRFCKNWLNSGEQRKTKDIKVSPQFNFLIQSGSFHKLKTLNCYSKFISKLNSLEVEYTEISDWNFEKV